MIGSIGFNNYNSIHKRIELSYDLACNYWQKGIMTKSIKTVADYIFNNWQINRVEAFCAIENESSIKILQKCGFTKEGRLRQHRIHQGKAEDVFIFSLLFGELVH